MKRLLLLFLFPLLFLVAPALALDCDGDTPNDPKVLNEYITACQQKITSLQGEQATLKATLSVLNSKIRLTNAQINQTIAQIKSLEKDIGTLTEVIADLNQTLDRLTSVYLARVKESYKRRPPSSLVLLLSSKNFADFFTQERYLSVIKARDQLILSEMTAARQNYNTQKDTKVEKQTQVEALKNQLLIQQANLRAQQKGKNDLLVITQNDEKKYQNLLDQARAELEAINAILAGGGQEQEIREVSAGEVIAHVEPNRSDGDYCNSSGPHLHFIIADNANTFNPFNYLKSIDYENVSGGDPFNPTGSWDWPLNPKIILHQGYGSTWAVRNTWVGKIYQFHNGLDLTGGSDEIRAIQPGKLFRGSYPGKRIYSKSGCSLLYVKVDHKDSDLDSYYLHVSYN